MNEKQISATESHIMTLLREVIALNDAEHEQAMHEAALKEAKRRELEDSMALLGYGQ